MWQNCMKQGSLYECPSKPLQLLDKGFVYKHEFQNLAMALLMIMNGIFLANILKMKKHQVKLKPIDLQCTVTVTSVYVNRHPVYGNLLSLFFEYEAYKPKLTVYSISRRVHLTINVLYRMVYYNFTDK